MADVDNGQQRPDENQPLVDNCHNSFRAMREERDQTAAEKFAIRIIKSFFSTAGFWMPSNCCVIYIGLLLMVSLYQLIYDFFTVCHCPNFNCRFLVDKTRHKNPSRKMQNAAYTLASLGGFFSYFLMTVTLYRAQKRRNALRPKSILLDVQKVHLFLLVALIGILTSSWIGSTFIFYYLVRHQISFGYKFAILATGVGSQLFTQLTGIIACFVFAAISFAITTFASDLITRITRCESQNINQLIVIHREFADIVRETVESFALWFVFHWVSYALTTVMALLVIAVHFGGETNNLKRTYLVMFFVVHLFMFVFPCGCAAYITSTCNEIQSILNNRVEDSWPAGHLFRERDTLQLFITYARESAVSFKIGRITFTSTLAWVSFFLSSSGLLIKFF